MTTLETYFEQNILLAKSITIRLIDVGIAMNKGLVEEGYTIPSDKTKWKYFMNLAGIRHETNSEIEVTVIELGEKQPLSKELLDTYSYTKSELMSNGDMYDALIEEYPDDILFIHGCIYNEMDIEDIIDAEDGTIISYNSDLVETSEYRLIKELEVWVKDFIKRYHVRSYSIVDELYVAAFVGVLYAQIPTKLTNLRFDKALTNEAHSFHMEQFFRSNLDTWDNIDILNTETKYWLYKNLPWLINNIGRNEAFDKIVDNILTPNAIGIGKYIIRRTNPTLNANADTDTTISAYSHGDITIKAEAINSYYDESKNNITSIESMVMKEINSEGSENISDEDQESTRISAMVAETQDTFDKTYRDNQTTKIMEISTYDIYKFSGLDLFKTILDYWTYCVSMDSLQYQVEYTEPNDNQIYTLTPKAGLLVLMKMMITLTKQPDILIKQINYDVPLQLTSDIITAAYEELFDDELTSKHLQELIDNYPYITKVSSSVTEFNVLLQEIIKYYEYWWVIDANSENAFVSANLKYLANLVTAKGSIVLTDNEDGVTIDELLAEEDISFNIEDTWDLESSIKAIMEAFTGYDIDTFSELTNIVTNIKALLVKLFSYTTQIITSADSSQSLDNVRYNNTQVMYSRKGIATVTEADFKQLEEDYVGIDGVGNNFVDGPTGDHDDISIPKVYTLPEQPITGKLVIMPNTDYSWIAPVFGASWCVETFGINHGNYAAELIEGITLSLAMKQLEEDYVEIDSKTFWNEVLYCLHVDMNNTLGVTTSELPEHPIKIYSEYRDKEISYSLKPNFVASFVSEDRIGINHGDYKEPIYEWEIKINKLPDKIDYVEDYEVLDITGLEVAVYYTDDQTFRLLSENEYTYSPSGLVTLDTKTITVTYKDMTTSFDINVSEATPKKLEIYNPADYLDYIPGMHIDTKNLVLKLTYNNKKEELVYPDQFTVIPMRDLTLDDTKVTCYYLGLSCSYDITVGYLTGLEVQTLPNKLVYEVEDYFDNTGLEIIAAYSNKYTRYIADYTSTVNHGDQLLTVDNNYIITVIYTNPEHMIEGESVSTTYDICVYAAAYITVTNLPKTTYYLGEDFETEGLEVTLTYTNGYTRILDASEYTVYIDQDDFKTTTGNKTVTITYVYDRLDNPVFETTYVINVYAEYYTFNMNLTLDGYYIHEDALTVDNTDSCIIVGELGEDYTTYPFVSSAETAKFGFILDNISNIVSKHVLNKSDSYIKTTLSEISNIDYVDSNHYALHTRNDYGFTKVIYLKGYTTVYININNLEKQDGLVVTDISEVGPYYSTLDSNFPSATYFSKDASCKVFIPIEYRDIVKTANEEITYDTFHYNFTLDGLKVLGKNISVQAFEDTSKWLQAGGITNTGSSVYTTTNPSELTFNLEAIRNAVFDRVIYGDTGCVTLRWKEISNALDVSEQGFVRTYNNSNNEFGSSRLLNENELLYIGVNTIEVVEGIAETELDVEPNVIKYGEYEIYDDETEETIERVWRKLSASVFVPRIQSTYYLCRETSTDSGHNVAVISGGYDEVTVDGNTYYVDTADNVEITFDTKKLARGLLRRYLTRTAYDTSIYFSGTSPVGGTNNHGYIWLDEILSVEGENPAILAYTPYTANDRSISGFRLATPISDLRNNTSMGLIGVTTYGLICSYVEDVNSTERYDEYNSIEVTDLITAYISDSVTGDRVSDDVITSAKFFDAYPSTGYAFTGTLYYAVGVTDPTAYRYKLIKVTICAMYIGTTYGYLDEGSLTGVAESSRSNSNSYKGIISGTYIDEYTANVPTIEFDSEKLLTLVKNNLPELVNGESSGVMNITITTTLSEIANNIEGNYYLASGHEVDKFKAYSATELTSDTSITLTVLYELDYTNYKRSSFINNKIYAINAENLTEHGWNKPESYYSGIEGSLTARTLELFEGQFLLDNDEYTGDKSDDGVISVYDPNSPYTEEQANAFNGALYWDDEISGKYGITTIDNSYVIGISVTQQPTKTSYKEGESFDTTGMVVTAYKADGTSFEVTDYSYTPSVFDFTGETTISVQYQGFIDTLTINVVGIERIEVTTQPTTVKYKLGESFDPEGMVISAIYSDGTTSEVITDYVYDLVTPTSSGDYTITITYTKSVYNKTSTYTTTLTISVVSIVGIYVSSQPDTLELKLGKTLSDIGIVISALYSDGYTTEVVNNYVCDFTTPDSEGVSTATITYTEEVFNEIYTYTTTLDINIIFIDSIYIYTLPNVEYLPGDVFDTTGMVVHAVYTDSTEEVITDYDITTPSMNTVGEQTITVTYSITFANTEYSYSTTFNITVSSTGIVKCSMKLGIALEGSSGKYYWKEFSDVQTLAGSLTSKYTLELASTTNEFTDANGVSYPYVTTTLTFINYTDPEGSTTLYKSRYTAMIGALERTYDLNDMAVSESASTTTLLTTTSNTPVTCYVTYPY